MLNKSKKIIEVFENVNNIDQKEIKINPKRKTVGKIRKISDKKKKIIKNKKDIVEKPKNKFLKTLWKRRKKAS